MKKFLKENWFIVVLIILVVIFRLTCSMYRIQSGSMEPTIKTGSIAVVCKVAEPKVGDIAAYQKGGNVIVHRIVGTSDTGFIFQGDANNVIDGESITEDRILGKYLFSIGF